MNQKGIDKSMQNSIETSIKNRAFVIEKSAARFSKSVGRISKKYEKVLVFIAKVRSDHKNVAKTIGFTTFSKQKLLCFGNGGPPMLPARATATFAHLGPPRSDFPKIDPKCPRHHPKWSQHYLEFTPEGPEMTPRAQKQASKPEFTRENSSELLCKTCCKGAGLQGRPTHCD